MKFNSKFLLAPALFAITLSLSCADISQVKEQQLGPFKTVCVESFSSYSHTNHLIDSLKNALKAINVSDNGTFAIIYNRRSDTSNTQFHSIAGCILPDSVAGDSAVIISLMRNNFHIRDIGRTQCMVVESSYKDFSTDLRSKVYSCINDYISKHNYSPIPEGEIGVTEFYNDDNILFAAEVRKDK